MAIKPAASLLSLLASLHCLAVAPRDAEQRIRSLIPEAEVKALPGGEWTVEQAMENPFVGLPEKSSPPRKITSASAFGFAGLVVLEDASDGHWLEGQSSAPGQLRYSREFQSFQEFLDGNSFAPLPAPPAGFELRQLMRMPEPPTRIVADLPGNFLYVLCGNGNVYCIDLLLNQMHRLMTVSSYAREGEGSFMGIALDRDGRMYLVGNHADDARQPLQNVVTIYRTTSRRDGHPADPKPWFRISLPYGINTFNHGVSHIAQGPDGMIYVSSGSRTDHGEAGNEPGKSTAGEDSSTACIWRLDPKSDAPKLEIFAKGLRNAFGFCWDDRGRMFATENGPNADPPEELNLIEQGKHYGFPFRFSTMTSKAYADQPDAPPGFRSEPPMMNIGPGAGGSGEHPLGTFDPHSSPAGIVYLNTDFPESHRGHFLIVRFGNLIDLPKDVGFDLVEVAMQNTNTSQLQAEVRRFLSPIARPTAICLAPGGRIFISEYSREVKHAHDMLPGRILELRVRKQFLKDTGR